MCDGLREGGWWGGWLQQSFQSIKDRVSMWELNTNYVIQS